MVSLIRLLAGQSSDLTLGLGHVFSRRPLVQVNEVAAVISEIVADDANIIFGTSVDESFQDEISVTVVATSFGELW